MADIDISAILEESPQSASISVTQDGLSVVERLLVATDSVGPSDFSALIAVRYLGGILERPSFWLQTGSIYGSIIKKLIVKTAVFLKDLGVDSPEDIIPMESSDFVGIDILCQALLQGIYSWMVGRGSDLMEEFWYEPLLQVILLLRQPKSEDLLPNSWAFATSPEMKRCIPTSSRIQIFSALVAPGSLGPSNGAIPSYTPRLEPPKSQRVSQQAFFGYFGLKGTPLADHESDLRSQAQFPAEEDTFPPIATGSGAREVLSSDDGTETEVSSPAVTRKTDSRGWWPWRAFHLSKIRNAAHVQHSNDPTASTAPERPAPTNGESPFPDLVRNSSTGPETSSPSRNPPDPENPLVIFNSRAQKRNLSVGWVYSARHPTKTDSAPPPAQGEPLHVWSVKVLVDGKEFGHGTGNSKKAGRRAAAQQALALMNAQGSTQSLSSSSHSHSHSARAVESGSELTNEQPATT
ncbi:hypothetical protein C8R43DRAFT_1165310 [Mycena crocata]|nr:hypothetical protein C8R43DRAFT_1165310 [Mycena crocata]